MATSKKSQISPYWRNQSRRFPLSADSDEWAEVAALKWSILEVGFP